MTDIKSRPSSASRLRRVLPLRRGEALRDVVRANRPLIGVKLNIGKLPSNKVGEGSALVFGDSGGLLVGTAVPLSL
jgi:hypothetical protein